MQRGISMRASEVIAAGVSTRTVACEGLSDNATWFGNGDGLLDIGHAIREHCLRLRTVSRHLFLCSLSVLACSDVGAAWAGAIFKYWLLSGARGGNVFCLRPPEGCVASLALSPTRALLAQRSGMRVCTRRQHQAQTRRQLPSLLQWPRATSAWFAWPRGAQGDVAPKCKNGNY